MDGLQQYPVDAFISYNISSQEVGVPRRNDTVMGPAYSRHDLHNTGAIQVLLICQRLQLLRNYPYKKKLIANNN